MAKKGSGNNTALVTLKPSEVKAAVGQLAEMQRSGFLWGPPGIGKSQILKQIAEDRGMGFQDIRLSQVEPTDIRGIPVPVDVPDPETGGVRRDVVWAPPSFFERDPSKPTFYLFDEMNSAPPSIQAAAYQIVLDRKLGDFALGPNDVVMAAGNRETDRGTTFNMATPLMNRFIHLEMVHDFDDWQEHAISRKYHPDVIGFLNFQKGKLFDFDPTTASRGFPTPRSWEMVSDIFNTDPSISGRVLQALVGGAVGDGVAAEFLTYRKKAEHLPKPADILSGKVKKLDKYDASLAYVLTTGLCFELDSEYKRRQEDAEYEDEYNKKSDAFFNFIMENFQPEMVILAAKVVLSTFRVKFNTSKVKKWKEFTDEYSDFILETN